MCMYINMCLCMSVLSETCVHVYVCAYVFICVCMYMCMHALCCYVCSYVFIYASMYYVSMHVMDMYISMQMCMHI